MSGDKGFLKDLIIRTSENTDDTHKHYILYVLHVQHT